MPYLDELREEHGDRLVPHITDEHGRMQVADLLAAVPHHAELYMCGPIRLMQEIQRLWERSDRDLTALRFETFGNSGWYEAQPFVVKLAAFVLSELKTAFQIGCMLFIPFLVIDIVVASLLMSMGMMMLSPLVISLPLKLLLFVLVDGWSLTVNTLVTSVQGI